MSDLLGRLDAAIDGLCPCGAAPRPGSAYCSYDCEPNHRSIHSQAETDGTQMRWRPDLVTAQDATGLTPFDHPALYGGLHNAQIFEHPDGRLHLRLDDGHRYIGCDIPAETYWAARETRALDDRWDALERELGKTRHLEPQPELLEVALWGRPGQHLYGWPNGNQWVAARGHTITGRAHGPIRENQAVYIYDDAHHGGSDHNPDPPERLPRSWDRIQPEPGSAWSLTSSNPLADIQAFMASRAAVNPSYWLYELSGTAAYLDAVEDAMLQIQTTGNAYIQTEPAPKHPMLAAIEARRHRNTGPTQSPRAPRNLGPRRRR